MQCTYLFSGFPIEKYVGWTDSSSYFIFYIGGVIPNFLQGCQIVVYGGWVERAVVNPAEMAKETIFQLYNPFLKITCKGNGNSPYFGGNQFIFSSGLSKIEHNEAIKCPGTIKFCFCLPYK